MAPSSRGRISTRHLIRAHLEGTYLLGAHLEAPTSGAHLDSASSPRAHLEGADLSRAIGLTQAQIDQAFGDAATKLPEGLCRPAHWTNPDGGEGPAPAA